MEQSVKVIGKITLPDAPKKYKCVCHDCGSVLDDSCGDPRHKITTYLGDNKTEERMVCDVCADELFPDLDDLEPGNIFDGTPDWMRMCY